MNKVKINRQSKLIFFILIFFTLLTKTCLLEAQQNRDFIPPMSININNAQGMAADETLKFLEANIFNMLMPTSNLIQPPIIPLSSLIQSSIPINNPMNNPIQTAIFINSSMNNSLSLPIQPAISMNNSMDSPINNPATIINIMSTRKIAPESAMPIPAGPLKFGLALINPSNMLLETTQPISIFDQMQRNNPFALSSIGTSSFVNHPLGNPIINPMMINPVVNYPIMTNQMVQNTRFNNPVMINNIPKNPMAGTQTINTYPINSYPMYNQVLKENGAGIIFNFGNPFQQNNDIFENAHFPEPIDLLNVENFAENNNSYIPYGTIILDSYPQTRLMLLERFLGIPDKIILSKNGRECRIEHYTIYGSNDIFEIIVPATFTDYDPFGSRKHFYDPRTGKTITALSSNLGFTVTGSAPNIILEPYPVPDYAWWYGCSPTSAGMLMGYYDWNGYPNMIGTNIPDAELLSFTSLFNPNNFTSDYYLINLYLNDPVATDPPLPTLLCNRNIASAGHITDFWSTPNSLIDPLPTGIPHVFDCLADFMGTSQLNVGTYYNSATGTTETISNPDGQTSFWWYNDGTPFTDQIIALDPDIINASGMYGMIEYANFRGYAATGFNQRPDTWIAINEPASLNPGFSFLDFKNEILAGRPVLILMANGSYAHTVLGFGYNEDTTSVPPVQEILLRDTWKAATIDFFTMPWGGTYPNPIDPAYPYESILVISFSITTTPIL